MYLFSKFSGVDPVAVKKIIVTRYDTTLFYVFLQFCNKKEPLKMKFKTAFADDDDALAVVQVVISVVVVVVLFHMNQMVLPLTRHGGMCNSRRAQNQKV